MNRRQALLALVGVVAAAAIGATSFFALRPRQIPKLIVRLGQDKCARCGMIISDLAYAAALYLEGEDDWRKYDDIGCMLKDYIKYEGKVIAVKVFDYETKEELEAKEAHYIKADPKRLWTPMNTGIVAVKDMPRAEKLAHDYNGHVFRWREIVEEVKRSATH